MLQLSWVMAILALAASPGWAGEGPPHFQVHRSAHGDILADANGMTLYAYDGDARYRPRCTGECAEAWRPFAVEEGRKHGFGYWTPITRTDGVRQWTYGGLPLYTFHGDVDPGDTKGERHGPGGWRAARALCMPVDAEGRLRDEPVIKVVDAALEAGMAPLRELRRWCGVDLGELAERSGTDVAVLAAYEGGRGELSLPELAAVANALGIPVYLLQD